MVPVSAQLIRLYGDYLHAEYGDLDCDYVFVNLFGGRRGQAMGYPAVYDLVRRLRRRTGIDFDLHWFRHSAATRMLRDRVPIEVVSSLLGHSSVVTDRPGLRASDRRGRPQGAGGGGLVQPVARCGCEPGRAQRFRDGGQPDGGHPGAGTPGSPRAAGQAGGRGPAGVPP